MTCPYRCPERSPEARRSRVARSAIARDAVGDALDVGGAASHAARRPLASTIASTA